MNRVLIITYYWPPGSGAGVQRWLKFSKFMPQNGWEPVILTVDPEHATYPATDISLGNEIPESLKVYKTRATDYFRFYKKDKSKIPSAGFAANGEKSFAAEVSKFIRGNFFIPDPRRGWNRFAFRKACEIIESENIRHIITTSPPHSTQLIGLKLKRKYPDTRWIADLRDPWTDIYYYDQFHPSFISRMIDEHYEKRVLRSADKIITVGNTLKKLFASKAGINETGIEVISNGYDNEDFKDIPRVKTSEFTISYIGTLSDTYPVKGLLDALDLIQGKGTGIRLRFIGMVAGKQKELIMSAAGNSNVEFIPYVDHRTAIMYMINTSLLLLIIPDHHSNKSIITGKLFEYLASGNPVLCLGPADGDAAVILGETGHGLTFDYNDIQGISGFLSEMRSGEVLNEKISPVKFSRKELIKRMIEILLKI